MVAGGQAHTHRKNNAPLFSFLPPQLDYHFTINVNTTAGGNINVIPSAAGIRLFTTVRENEREERADQTKNEAAPKPTPPPPLPPLPFISGRR